MLSIREREVKGMSEKKNEHHHHGEHKKNHDGMQSEEQLKNEETQNAETPTAETDGRPSELPIDTAEDLKQQLEAQSDRYLRLMAEFDNFKKRVSRDYERLVESANERLMAELIDVRENFERAVKSSEQCTDLKSISDGMKLIFTKFDNVLQKNGLTSFGTTGEPFNPQLHDALMKIPNDTIPEDHIVEVFEKGYTLKKQVVRHAKVVVSGGTAKKETEV
jgi:molecular chaperone GrpE